MHPTRHVTSCGLILAVIAATAFCGGGCGPSEPSPATRDGAAGAPSNGMSGANSGGGASGTAGALASGSSGGGPVTGLAGANSGGFGGTGIGGALNGGAPGAGAPGGGAGGSFATGGSKGGSGTGGGAGGPPDGCNLPATVSFKNDVQKFLIPSCSGTGCHVIDSSSTMSAGGFDHAYDWITATSHASSCPSGAPKRFEVVIAVINAANPPSCSKSRKMPPDPGTHAPLTPCQIATLQAWLDEPLVTQTHRVDDTSPTTPYPMPPFN